MKPVVYLLVGLPGSGKTTYAKALRRRGVVRLSVDEQVIVRHGRLGKDYPEDKHLALLSGVIEAVDFDAETVYVNRTKDQIKNSPEFDPDSYREQSYRSQLGTYYGPGGTGWPKLGVPLLLNVKGWMLMTRSSLNVVGLAWAW